MANQVGLFFPNRAYEASAGGGSWQAGFGISSVTTRGYDTMARSTDATTPNTQFILDLGATRNIRSVGLFGHNLTTSATLEVNVGTTSGGAEAYDGSAVSCWPMASLHSSMTAIGVEDDSWYTDGWPIIQVLPAYAAGRYVQFKISDTGNPAGFVEVALAFAGGGLIPGHNMDYQAYSDGHIDLSGVEYGPDGALLPYARGRVKSQGFVLSWMTHTEMAIVREMERQCGMVGDVLYVPDCNDSAFSQRYGFLGTLSEMTKAEYPFFDTRKKAFNLREYR